jgi:ABC-type multidrug transport system ATPase subunit
MRRIVTFIAAAALDRPLLVVDEATAALDPEAVVVLRETMRALARRGAGVLVATQDLHFAEQTCDSVALLSGGRLVEAGAVDALRARHSAPSLEAVFLSALGQRALLREIRGALDAL